MGLLHIINIDIRTKQKVVDLARDWDDEKITTKQLFTELRACGAFERDDKLKMLCSPENGASEMISIRSENEGIVDIDFVRGKIGIFAS